MGVQLKKYVGRSLHPDLRRPPQPPPRPNICIDEEAVNASLESSAEEEGDSQDSEISHKDKENVRAMARNKELSNIHVPTTRGRKALTEGQAREPSSQGSGGSDSSGTKRKRDVAETNGTMKTTKSPTQNDVIFVLDPSQKSSQRRSQGQGYGKVRSSLSSQDRSVNKSSNDAPPSSLPTPRFHVPQQLNSLPIKKDEIKDFLKPPKPSHTPIKMAGFHKPISSPASSSPLSSLPPSQDNDEVHILENPPSPPHDLPQEDHARCPMCNNPVDADRLSAFTATCRKGIPSYQQAQRFCTSHRELDAEEQWSAARYPTIDWDNFDTRLERFHGTIGDLLHNRIPSSFRKDLEAKSKAGQLTKRLRDADAAAEARNAGYYGEQGADRMSEYIMKHFMREMRKVASKDPLFTELTVAGFVLGILVPQLALLLIREDLNCDETKAKEILKESAEMGEIFNRNRDDESDEEEVINVQQDDQDSSKGYTEDGFEVLPDDDFDSTPDEKTDEQQGTQALRPLGTNQSQQSRQAFQVEQSVVLEDVQDNDADDENTEFQRRRKRTRSTRSMPDREVIQLD